MTEKELEKRFVDFLLTERGFPKGSILTQASFEMPLGKIRRRYIVDLLLLDTDFNNYLGLVEFKTSSYPPRDSLFQVKSYLNAISKPNLPAYLVTQNDEFEFRIYLLDNDDWKPIDRDDFPQYDSLRSKNQADQKRLFEEIEETKEKEIKSKTELVRSTAYSTLISLIVGIIATITLSITIFKDGGSRMIGSDDGDGIVCCDSLSQESDRVREQIKVIEEKIRALNKRDSVLYKIDKDVKMANLNERLKTIENSISQSPDRLLRIQELTYDMRTLENLVSKEKEISDIKITNLKERIDQLTLWTSGLIITIIGSIIGFAVNAFRKT